jgi:hypothetical protein
VSLIRRSLFPLLALLLAVMYAVSIRGLRGSALAYPAIIVAVVLVLGLANLAIGLRRRAEPRPILNTAWQQAGLLWSRLRASWRPIVLVIALAFYAWVMQYVGFYTATLVFLFGTFVLLRVPLVRAAITTVCCLPMMYLVFSVLFEITTLPRGALI